MKLAVCVNVFGNAVAHGVVLKAKVFLGAAIGATDFSNFAGNMIGTGVSITGLSNHLHCALLGAYIWHGLGNKVQIIIGVYYFKRRIWIGFSP